VYLRNDHAISCGWCNFGLLGCTAKKVSRLLPRVVGFLCITLHNHHVETVDPLGVNWLKQFYYYSRSAEDVCCLHFAGCRVVGSPSFPYTCNRHCSWAECLSVRWKVVWGASSSVARATDRKGGQLHGAICPGPQVGAPRPATLSRDRNTLIEQSS